MPTDPLEQIFLHPGRGDCYPNAQSHLMNALLFTGIALDSDRLRKVAAGGVNLMATAFYPDGGTAYIDVQNECFTYHGIMIEDLVRYWQVTGDKQALDLARSSRWYYPISITPQGVAEYSSAPCWKHYWNAVKGTSTASILASLMACPYNAAVAAINDPEAHWLATSLYVPVKPQPWWDNAVFFDRNIEGPRGRFGQYSFCGTARNTLQAKRGKQTYVGSLWVEDSALVQRSTRGWPLNAALDSAWAEVRLNTKPETLSRWDTHACLSRDETTSSLASESFGAVTAHYRLAQYSQPPIPFQGTQQWLLTPQRIVGLIVIESLEDQDAYSMAVALKLLSGRDGSGIRKEWKAKGPNLFEYGAFNVRLWPLGDPAHDLVSSGKIDTAYTDTFSGNSDKSGIMTLVDPAAAQSQQKTKNQYSKGTRYHAAIEIYPTTFGGATSFKLAPCTKGLIAFELEEPHQTLRLVHNPTAEAAGYATAGTGLTLHRSGERHRMPFLPAVQSVAPTPAPSLIAIPAGEHIVLSRS
jgi:hypothetical protein